jgi:hypothetical protein
MLRLLILTTLLSFGCSKDQSNSSEDYRCLNIEDSTLVSIFKKASPCEKIQILKVFKKDLLPSGEGYSNELIEEIESLTKKESSRGQTHFGLGYDSSEKLENDLNEWSKLLNCK